MFLREIIAFNVGKFGVGLSQKLKCFMPVLWLMFTLVCKNSLLILEDLFT